MIPEINRPEWAELVKGKKKPEISSFSLQMKINSLNRNYKNGLLSLNEAINDLHNMCIKYEKIYQEDLQKIFN